jgi:hypothetical protein
MGQADLAGKRIDLDHEIGLPEMWSSEWGHSKQQAREISGGISGVIKYPELSGVPNNLHAGMSSSDIVEALNNRVFKKNPFFDKANGQWLEVEAGLVSELLGNPAVIETIRTLFSRDIVADPSVLQNMPRNLLGIVLLCIRDPEDSIIEGNTKDINSRQCLIDSITAKLFPTHPPNTPPTPTSPPVPPTPDHATS